MLTFKVHVNISTEISDKLAGSFARAESILAQQVAKDTEQFVPALTGSFSQRTVVDGNEIIYPGPTASMLYRGKLMVDPTTGSSYAPKGGTKVLTDKNLVFNTSVHGQAQSHWFEASKAQNLKQWVETAEKAVKDELK